MDKIHDQLNEKLIEFIKQQKIFFVASAPLAADGLISISRPRAMIALSCWIPSQLRGLT